MRCEECGKEVEKLIEIDDGNGEKVKVCEDCLMDIIANRLADAVYPEESTDIFKDIDKKYIQ